MQTLKVLKGTHSGFTSPSGPPLPLHCIAADFFEGRSACGVVMIKPLREHFFSKRDGAMDWSNRKAEDSLMLRV